MYWAMADKGSCNTLLSDISEKIEVCDALAAAFIPISLFNTGILFALFLCLVTITVSALQLNHGHFRMANFLLFLSGTFFMCLPGIWHIIIVVMTKGTGDIDAYNRNFISLGDIVLPLCGLAELTCFCISRWFTIQMYDAKFLENLIADSDDEEEKSQTNSLIGSVN